MGGESMRTLIELSFCTRYWCENGLTEISEDYRTFPSTSASEGLLELIQMVPTQLSTAAAMSPYDGDQTSPDNESTGTKRSTSREWVFAEIQPELVTPGR